ncbi:MAG TPA: phospholipase A2 [Nocardioides sp.]|uniref:phospholipase A2 n=1 Tax=Nocardioides sp. TaxID=35761 RepID=UPI002E3690B5|nr:phospholipase A2 [Nocardioides sp.]HEX5088113.1 phospholipase A2 [Nocardioides sp.]
MGIILALGAALLASPAVFPATAAEANPGAGTAVVEPAPAAGAAAPQTPEPGPVPELATEYSSTVRNADGSYTAEVSVGPVNFQDDRGNWMPISNQLVDAPGTAYAVENEANDYTVSIPENPATTPVRFELEGDWVSMKLIGSSDVSPDVDGAVANFEDLAPDADEVAYQATDSGVKETISLDSTPTSRVSYVYDLKVSAGLTPVLTSQGMVEFRNGQGAVQFVVPVGSMTDSASEPAFSDAVDYRLQRVTSGWQFTITPDLTWLTDPARVYPVKIDPTVDKQVQKDCFLQQEAPATTHCGEAILKVGATNSLQLRRALFDFNVNGIPAGATVNNATAWIWMDQNSTAGSGGATTYALYNPTKTWSNCASWGYTCSGGDTWVGGGGGGQISANAVSMGGTTSSWQGWDITGRVAGWLNGTYENRGVLLAQTGENVKKVLGFVSSTYPNTGIRPLLRVTYTPLPPQAPSSPANLSFTPCVSPCSVAWQTTDSLTPTLLAVASDADTPSLTYTWQVAAPGGAVIAQGTSTAAQGQVSTWTVPSGVLSDETVYSFRVGASDEATTSWSGWSDLPVYREAGDYPEIVSADGLQRVVVEAVWEAALDCMKESGAASQSLTVADVFGTISTSGEFLPPTLGAQAPTAGDACGDSAGKLVKDTIGDTTDEAVIDSDLAELTAELRTNQVSAYPLASRGDVIEEAGEGDPSSDELASRPNDYADCHPSLVASFVSYLNYYSDESLADFKWNSNHELPCRFNWSDDVCTNAPDSGLVFDFTYPCKRHDFGYRNLKRAESWYGTNTWRKRNKNVADEQFFRDMIDHCSTRNLLIRPACERIASDYYVAVAVAGDWNTLGYGTPLTYVK